MKSHQINRRLPGGEWALVGLVVTSLVLGSIVNWMIEANSRSRAPRFGIEMFSDTDSVAQLFYDTGEGFNEGQSDSVFVKKGRLNHLRFSIVAPSIKGVRFDPLTVGGTVRITRVWIEDGFGTERISLSAGHFAAGNQISSLRHDATSAIVVIPSGSDDPSLLLAFDQRLILPKPKLPWLLLSILVGGICVVVAGVRSHTDSWKISGFGAAVAEILIVIPMFLWPLHRTLDYPLFDEANYLGWGQRFLRTGSLGDIAGTPGYHLWYAGLSRVFDAGNAIFANEYALKSLLVLVVFAIARRWFGSWMGAALVAVGASISLWQLTFPLLVYHAAFGCFALAIAVADRSRVAAIGLLALAALTRLEYAFAAVAAVLLWLVIDWHFGFRGSEPKSQRDSVFLRFCAFIPLAIAVYAAAHVQGWDFGGRRSWFAFEQHYAVSLVESGREKGVDPWLDYRKIVDRDFPGIHSFGQAVRTHPIRVLEHIGRNLRSAPARVVEFFATTHGGKFRSLVAAALLLGAGWCAIALPSAEIEITSDWIRRRRHSAAVAVAGTAAVLPGLIVYAKTAYLLPVVPLIWLLTAWVAVGLRSRFRLQALTRWAWLGASLLVIAVATVIASAPSPLAIVHSQPVRENVATILRECPAPARLLGVGAESYTSYLGSDYSGIEPLASESGGQETPEEESFSRLIDRWHPDAILVTQVWRGAATFDVRGETTLLQKSWRRIPLSDGDLYVAGAPR